MRTTQAPAVILMPVREICVFLSLGPRGAAGDSEAEAQQKEHIYKRGCFGKMWEVGLGAVPVLRVFLDCWSYQGEKRGQEGEGELSMH